MKKKKKFRENDKFCDTLWLWKFDVNDYMHLKVMVKTVYSYSFLAKISWKQHLY